MAKNRTLIAEQFREDPRIKQAQNLIQEALDDHQKQISQIRPSDQTLVKHYQDLLKEFSEARGAPLYFPYIGSGMGNGALVELADGSIKYDMISGIGTHYWGHHHPALLEASFDAALSDTIMQGNLQQNSDSIELSKLLIQCSGLDHCFLSSTGAMANENALKIIFQKKHPAHRLLAFEKCFMGRTLALSQLTDKPAFREGLPINIFVDYVPFYKADRPEESTKETLEAIKRHLTRYPNQHAAMCFELIQGEGGFYPGSKDFFIAIMELLKEHGIAVFVDEVQTFGRTSSLFAFQHFQLDKYVDAVSIGKLSQVCATLFRKEFKPRPGLLSQTFTASTAAIHACLLIIRSLLNEGYFGPNGKIEQTHRYFVKGLQEIEKRHPLAIRGPYGVGAMLAFTPFDGDSKRVAQYAQDLFNAGVISFVAGSNPTRIRFLIPMGAITFRDIDQVMQIIEQVLESDSSSQGPGDRSRESGVRR